MDLREPTPQERVETTKALTNVAKLLKTGLFAGVNAQAVTAAIQWLENGIKFFGAEPEVEEKEKADLTLVPN